MVFHKLKAKLNNVSIQWKIFAYLIGFCTFLIVLLWLFQVVFLDDIYKNIKIREVKSTARSIVDNINKTNYAQTIDKLSFRNEVCVEILSDQGTQLYSSDNLNNCIIHKMPLGLKGQLFIDTQKNGGELLEYYSREHFKDKKNKNMNPRGPMNPGQQESIILSKIIQNKKGETMLVLINSVVLPVNATVATLRMELYVITLCMILFATLLAFLIAKRVSKPIKQMNQSAKILATGNYNTQFNAIGYKEIGELSNTLNYAASELSKVDTLRNELIANISHDLRTPLTLIGGYAEVMRDLPEENTPENAQIIIDESKRLTTLVNDMLDMSKLQAGMQRLNITSFSITEQLRGVVNRLNELVKRDGYSIELLADQDVLVTGDATRIAQAFYNLAINAINYTGEDKHVVVKQIVTDETVRIEVIDSGVGIAPENLKFIWDRYFKEDKNHKRSITGIGLGLSIVRSIIELHNGDYGVISELGAGSTFWFMLSRQQ